MQGAVLQIGASIEHEQHISHEARAARQAAVRGFVQGAQISAPFGRYASAVDVLEALGSSRGATV